MSSSDQAYQTEKKNKPTASRFKQQTLPAWKPVLTPQSVLPVVFFIGILFIAIGIPLYIGASDVKEDRWDYTECEQMWANASAEDQGLSCGDLLEDTSKGYTNSSLDKRCECHVDISIPAGYSKHKVYVYYALDEFYQNHRTYVASRYDPQYRSVVSRGTSACNPYRKDDDGNFIAPCGLVPNSLFNDTIEFFKCTGGNCSPTQNSQRLTLSGKHISWASDRNTKFSNPKVPDGGDLCNASYFEGLVKPPNWPVELCKLGYEEGTVTSPDQIKPFYAWHPYFGSNGRGYENEDFIVWMRNAALPDFRKLYRKISSGELTEGNYVLRIFYNYPAKNFNGKKSVIISTVSWMGGKNEFLGICYLVVGSLCIAANVAFLIAMRFRKRELGSDKYLVWDQ